MKTTSKRLLVILTCLALATSAYALCPIPAEQLQQMVEQLRANPNDHALRGRIIKQAQEITPAPAIPEEAREPFIMGTTVLKKSSGPAGASKAVELFTQALTLAPWFADAYYNRALARETAGQFEPAIDDLKLYLAFTLTDAERREAQDKIYSLKADAQLDATKKAEQSKIVRAEEDKHQAQQAKRDVITQIKQAVGNRSYESKILSYSNKDENIWGGVTQYELFGGGTYYAYESEPRIYWKFFGERVELWNSLDGGIGALELVGESWGSQVTDMRWFMGTGGNSKSEKQVWVYFNLQNGYLLASSPAGEGKRRPLNDSNFDSNRRYIYFLYKPVR